VRAGLVAFTSVRDLEVWELVRDFFELTLLARDSWPEGPSSCSARRPSRLNEDLIHTNIVKSFYFVGTKFRGLMKMDMFADT